MKKYTIENAGYKKLYSSNNDGYTVLKKKTTFLNWHLLPVYLLIDTTTPASFY